MFKDHIAAALAPFLALVIALTVGLAHAQIPLPGPTCDPKTQSCIPPITPPGGPGTCGPGRAGSTCGGAGPATLGGGTGINVGAGNPINVITGNKYQREVDMPALPGVLGLEIVRHYNSVFSGPGHMNGIVGRGWKLSYETDLYATGRTIQIVQADGARIIFDRDPADPSHCTSANRADGTIRVVKSPRGSEYTWTWDDGRVLSFNSQGKLVQIAAASGEFVSMQHDRAGLLLSVTDPQGRALHLRYLDKKQAQTGDRFRGVQAVDTPVGRFNYSYGSPMPDGAAVDKAGLLANMVKVSLPGGAISRLYHYEDARHPTLLTGISVESIGNDRKPARQRIATYGYDLDGKAILTVRGEPARLKKGADGKPLQPAVLEEGTGVEQVTLDTSVGGRTVVTNSLGQKTVYRHAIVGGSFRLLEVRGAGCASCGETNVRYGYDGAGRLTSTTRLSTDGQPIQETRSEIDADGRTIKVSRIVYRSGKPDTPKWQSRFEYARENPQPVLIARPSVIPGREVRSRISYNEHGQILSVTQGGWAPAFDSTQAPAPIARTTVYRYATINGRSVLSEIDGPLVNGKSNSPLDSDITRFEWDGKADGIVAITEPGNFRNTVRYDQVGRIAAVANAEGKSTDFSYDARSQLIATSSDGVKRSIQYDAQGNTVEVGYGEGAQYRANAHFGIDGAGRNTWIASHLGILERRHYDTEGKLLETSTESASFKRTQRYGYDATGRLTSVADPAAGTRYISWNEHDLPDVTTDTLGRERRYRYDPTGNLAQVIEAANTVLARTQETGVRFEYDEEGSTTAVIAPSGAITRYVRDDFGNMTAIISADSGVGTRGYDAAGRLVASTDAVGNRASYEYDAGGRVTRQTVVDAKATEAAKKQVVTSWTYAGRRLVAIDHPEQAERYRYDERGLLACKTVILKLAGGGQVASITRYRYDLLGQLESTSLPDGSTIDYRRNEQNQVIALERSRIQTPWLRWLLPAKPIVYGLERDIVGLKRATYGNGIQASYERSKQGVLARIVYRDPRMPASSEQRSAALETLLGISPAMAAMGAPAPAAALVAALAALPGALGLPPDPKALLDHRYLWDVQGNLLHTRDKDAANGYAYDARDRLIAAATAPVPAMALPATASNASASANASFARYHYDVNGNRLLAQEGVQDQGDIRSNTVKTSYAPRGDRWQDAAAGGDYVEARYDAAGEPDRIGNRTFVWDALGKLLEVREGQRVLARYRYNYRTERIEKAVGGERTYYLYEERKLVAELDGKGAIRRQYVYLADQPVVIIDTEGAFAAHGEVNTALARFTADIGTVWHAWFGKGETTSYLHNNHLGAVEMVTDAKGKPIWQGTYSPFGKLIPAMAQGKSATVVARFELNLRLPGQYADVESGLYYNDHRYYDFARGRYLTPDQLGLRAGDNSYAYVNGNPLKYVDPSGLVLFAFDGTSNSAAPSARDSLSNVRKFFLAYKEELNGKAYYITGIGTTDENMSVEGGTADGNGFDERVALGFRFLDDAVDRAVKDGTAPTILDIDVVGFSRGAAEARVWMNRLVKGLRGGAYTSVAGNRRCINLRFEGLWDTVSHLGGLSGDDKNYNFAIPSAVKYVAQAVALNEHRGGPENFNGRSIFDSPSAANAAARIELGFIGSHADIGGGYGTGDLSDAALMWIIKQGQQQGIRFDEKLISKSGWNVVTSPILHDKSTNNQLPDQAPLLGDRDFIYGDGTRVKQGKAVVGGNTTKWTKSYISYYYHVCGPGSSPAVGLVDMKKYSAWLASQGVQVGYQPPTPTPLCN